MECVNMVFPIILYILGSVLLVCLILFVIKCMHTLRKVNSIIEDVQIKANKLDGVFHLIDNTTDLISGVSDKVIDFVTGAVTGLFTRRKKKGEENEE